MKFHPRPCRQFRRPDAAEEVCVPLYDYQCAAGHVYEKREPFGSPPQQPCDQCGKPARRLLNVPPIVFKGSGWYVTDSQRSIRSAVGMDRDGDDSSSDDASSDSDSDTSSSDTATEKPAAKKKAAAPKAKTSRTPKAKAAPAADD